MAQSTSFNTDQFEWKDVTIQIGSRVLTGVQGVRYKVSQEKQYLYGKGNKPLSIQRGNFNYDGSIRLLQSEVEALIAGAPDKQVQNYRGLTISIGYENEAGDAVVDVLSGVEFLDAEKAMDQGKLNMEIELPILFLDIKYNA